MLAQNSARQRPLSSTNEPSRQVVVLAQVERADEGFTIELRGKWDWRRVGLGTN